MIRVTATFVYDCETADQASKVIERLPEGTQHSYSPLTHEVSYTVVQEVADLD